MKKPNVLFIMTDQMRDDALSSGAGTPVLDKIAENGVRFTECHTTSPICAPARASLLCGCYPSEMGIRDNSPHIVDIEKDNWVRILQKNGWNTSIFGKSHYYAYNGSYPDMREMEDYMHGLGYSTVNEIPGPRVCGRLLSHMTAEWREKGLIENYRKDMNLRYGANQAISKPTILPFELYPDVYVPEKAISYFSSYDSNEPFFSFVSFSGPHDPWDTPESYMKLYEKIPTEKPLKEFSNANSERPRGIWDEDLEYEKVGNEEAAGIRRDYAAHVRLIDDQIGKLLTVMEERKLLDNTIIIFTSDHGEMNGDRGRLYKQNFLAPSVKVPLLVYYPGCMKGSRDSRLVELRDLGATILELCNIDNNFPGISIFSSNKRNEVYSEYRGESMIRTENWKMVVNALGEPYMLFDLEHDPNEMVNLASTGLNIEKTLLEKLEAHEKDIA